MTQQKNIVDNKRIARNTILLYMRMLFTMGISLYTSRVILNVLGVVDYGIYNVVGGVIAMFGFINASMSSATQRYITFALADGNEERLNQIFITSLQIHAFIAIIIIVLGETVGLWFLLNKLVIPDNRMEAAMWVYQCSILSSVVMIMSVPYNADIIAHEQMSAFAYISVLESILRLVVVFLLLISPFDKLVIYAVFILFVQILIRFIYTRYCSIHFPESKYRHVFDKQLFAEMSNFAGWSFFGNLAGALYTQGLNILLNVFFGPVVNAARGIAVQVQGAVQQFVTNFQMALNPQITKTYANGDLDNMHQLMFRSARFSFYLLYLLVLPIFFETSFILTVWLKTVPENTVIFTQLMLATSLIYTTANPCVIANQATGKIKVYQMVVGGILLLILPISFVFLKLGAPAFVVFVIHFCVEVMAQCARMLLLRNLINLSIKDYLTHIYIPIAFVVFGSIIPPFFIHSLFHESWIRFVAVGFTCVVSVLTSVYYLGLQKQERYVIKKQILIKIKMIIK